MIPALVLLTATTLCAVVQSVAFCFQLKQMTNKLQASTMALTSRQAELAEGRYHTEQESYGLGNDPEEPHHPVFWATNGPYAIADDSLVRLVNDAVTMDISSIIDSGAKGLTSEHVETYLQSWAVFCDGHRLSSDSRESFEYMYRQDIQSEWHSRVSHNDS